MSSELIAVSPTDLVWSVTGSPNVAVCARVNPVPECAMRAKKVCPF